MSRRLLVPLLSALALLLAAAPAVLAAPAHAGAPLAGVAADDDTVPADDACSDDPEVDLPACGEDSYDDAYDDGGVCGDDADWSDDDFADDEEWSDDDAELRADDDFADDCETVAPTVSDLAATVSGRGRRTRIRVTFTLDLPGEVELTLARTEPGVTRGRRCVPAPATPARAARKGRNAGGRHGRGTKTSGRSCTRTVALRGSAYVDGEEGANSADLRRRWGGRALPAGSYRLTATPTDDGGEPVSAAFTLSAVR